MKATFTLTRDKNDVEISAKCDHKETADKLEKLFTEFLQCLAGIAQEDKELTVTHRTK